ncbi:21762_t:CDS:2 [Gigaspora margarita]|uniref:21762_t:CDS:1 n=1 Tax=Gigaspora margarita TaxID=4874 RepID=A0ABM8W1I1_GIGMA|nr:21762_t:CDS:2 [Gigaspora margarita]
MNYSEYISGQLPLIISIPHDGQLFPPEIPDRKKNYPSVVKSNDLNTQDIGRELADKIMLHFNGKRPYLVINHLGRSKFVINRPIKEGVDGKDSITLTDIKDVETNFGQGLLIDIHGHGHPENFIEIGYVLSAWKY